MEATALIKIKQPIDKNSASFAHAKLMISNAKPETIELLLNKIREIPDVEVS